MHTEKKTTKTRKTSCPENYATDTILFVDNHELACDLFIPTWIGFGTLLCAMQLFIAIGHSYLWRRRQRALAEKQSKKASRFPFVPLFSWIFFLGFLLFMILSSTILVPGLPPFIFGFCWTIFAMTSLFYVYKFISLGQRVAFGMKSNSPRTGADTLSKLNFIGRFTFFLLILAVLGEFLSFCVLSFIFPKSYAVIQAGIGFGCCYLSLLLFLLMYHFERVIRAVKNGIKANAGNSSLSASKEMTMALRRLREQQISALLPLLVGPIVYLLLTIQGHHYDINSSIISSIFRAFETVGIFLILLSNLKAILCRRKLNENSISKSTGLNKAEDQGAEGNMLAPASLNTAVKMASNTN